MNLSRLVLSLMPIERGNYFVLMSQASCQDLLSSDDFSLCPRDVQDKKHLVTLFKIIW